MTTSVLDTLEHIIRADLSIAASDVRRDSRLIGDLGLDSLAFAIGVVAIEERFGVVLTEKELMGCRTVGDLEDVIIGKCDESTSGAPLTESARVVSIGGAS